MTKNLIVSFKDVSFGYGKELIFNNLNFSMEEGKFYLFMGSNGEGKSTFCKLLLGQCKPLSGNIYFQGVPVSKMVKNGTIGYVPQLGSGNKIHFPITLQELVGLSLYPRLNGWKRLLPHHKEMIREIIHTVGLKGMENMIFGNLSGGQRQKALLAKALVHQPSFLLFDEPTIGIDKDSKKELFDFIGHLHKKNNLSILMISHDPDDIKNYVDKVILLESGECKEVSL
ncbi:MAG: metal ABC transporter ATP-binding protein [Tissierellia bacterium]|nr:metal ABC transporter ATP-binding protein [Tissierellia bacterium]